MESGGPEPHEHEERVRAEIEAWKAAPPPLLSRVTRPLDKITGWAITQVPAVQKAVQGAGAMVNDLASQTVPTASIFGRFAKVGAPVQSLDDIRLLPLVVCDAAVGPLDMAYKAGCAAQGGAAGGLATINPIAGAAAIAADIPLFLGLCCRAAAEYGTYYGFDVTSQAERTFVLNVVGSAGQADIAGKQTAVAQLTRLSADLARRKSWEKLNSQVAARGLTKLMETVSIRVTKQKLAQIVPLAGVAIGAGFNYAYMGDVCVTAQRMYQDRWLKRQYPPDGSGVPVTGLV